MLRKLGSQQWIRHIAGRLLGAYMTLVWKTSRVTVAPEGAYDRIEAELPFILVFWHGQQFLMSYVVRHHWRPIGLFSRHGDAEINAIAVESHGFRTIRGSGDHGHNFLRKGAVTATLQMLDSLKEGCSLTLTADVPKIARVASKGIVTLARHSERPILPVAVSSSRRLLANSWDRASIYLPFGRLVVVFGEPIRVARRADDATIEKARALLEASLNEISAKAEALAGHQPQETRDGA